MSTIYYIGLDIHKKVIAYNKKCGTSMISFVKGENGDFP